MKHRLRLQQLINNVVQSLLHLGFALFVREIEHGVAAETSQERDSHSLQVHRFNVKVLESKSARRWLIVQQHLQKETSNI